MLKLVFLTELSVGVLWLKAFKIGDVIFISCLKHV
jgi:hypothetical protein